MGFDRSKFLFSLGVHHGVDVIWVSFHYDSNLVKYLRQSVVAHWSASKKSWYVRDVQQYRLLFGLPEKSIGKGAYMHIHPTNKEAFLRYREQLLLKGYSHNTIKTYCNEFAQLLFSLKDNPVESLTPDLLRRYCVYCIQKLKISENQMHSRLNAMKFYFEQVLHLEKFFFDIPRPKKPQLLPKALNVDEIKRLFAAVENLKHKVALQLCYGMGLRVSEIVQLKLGDIDSKAMRVQVCNAKGKKDRYVNLPHSILPDLRTYYLQYRPKEFLFEGQYGGSWSVRSVQVVFKSAMKKAGIHKAVGIHGLRHSYATHLLEQGTDISYIQELLGHEDVKTTMGYTKVALKNVSNVESPLDKLF